MDKNKLFISESILNKNNFTNDDIYIKIPNDLIRKNIAKEKIDSVLYIVYIMIGANRTFCANLSSISINDIFLLFFDKKPQKKPVLIQKIFDSLIYLKRYGYIDFDNSQIDNFKYSCLESYYIRVKLCKKFDPNNNYTYVSMRDFIKMSKNIDGQMLSYCFFVFLYISSIIGMQSSESINAYYKTIDTSFEETGVEKHIIIECFDLLCKHNILKRYKYNIKGSDFRSRIIYVKNDVYTDDNILNAINSLKKMYD